MSYRISGVDPAQFAHLYGMDDAALARHRAVRRIVAAGEGVPERIELRDAEPGETVLLVNHTHQPADSPYHASHAIFIREGARHAVIVHDTVPPVMARRLISLRAFDAAGMIVAFAVSPGTEIEPLILDHLARPEVAYLHAHYAGPGCFAARIDPS